MCYTNRQLKNRVAKMLELRTEIDRLQDELDAIKKDVQADMGDRETVDGEDFYINWKWVYGSRMDTTAFKKAHAALYKAFTVPTACRKFTYDLK